MAGPGVSVRRLGRPGDLGWVVMAHGEVYAEQFGWDTTFESLVAGITADFARTADDSGQAGWVAEARDERVGTLLVGTCVEFARRSGYEALTLWTNDVLVSARRLYERAGFVKVDEEQHHSFGHDLVAQTWRLDLGGPT
jgi:GNAT superfamily N-acetyltransferase